MTIPVDSQVGAWDKETAKTLGISLDDMIGPASLHEVLTSAFPTPVALPPRILEVQSGWDLEAEAPKIRVLLDGLAELSVPLIEKFLLEPNVDTFGPTDFPPAGTVRVWRQTAVTEVVGGLLEDLASDSRILPTTNPIPGTIVQLQTGTTIIYRKIVRKTNPSPGRHEALLAEPVGVPFTAATTTLFSPSLTEITHAVNFDAVGEFTVDRQAIGLAPASSAIMVVQYQEDDVEPGPWSVFIAPRDDLPEILDRSELPATTVVLDGLPASQLEATILLDAGAPSLFHGRNVTVGVTARRVGGSPFSESLVTWIGATTLVAPPALQVAGISQNSVSLLITHPTGERAVGAQVYRFPSNTTLAAEGVPLNRNPIAGAVFIDGATEANRLLEPPSPESGPPLPGPGDRFAYVATELVDTPFPSSALRTVGRKDVDPVPFTIFTAVNQAEIA